MGTSPKLEKVAYVMEVFFARPFSLCIWFPMTTGMYTAWCEGYPHLKNKKQASGSLRQDVDNEWMQ